MRLVWGLPFFNSDINVVVQVDGETLTLAIACTICMSLCVCVCERERRVYVDAVRKIVFLSVI